MLVVSSIPTFQVDINFIELMLPLSLALLLYFQFPNGLSSKYCLESPTLLNFSVQMGTGVSKKRRCDDILGVFNEVPCYIVKRFIFCSTFSLIGDLFLCLPIDGTTRIFSYHFMPQEGFEPTSESCTSLWEL